MFVPMFKDLTFVYFCGINRVSPLTKALLSVLMYPDTGIDALHLAPEIDIGEAKRRVGDRLCLIGNMHQLQTLLHGTPEDVVAEVRDRIEVLGAGGGYILAPAHMLQADTSPENIVAMFDTARRAPVPDHAPKRS